MSLVPADNLPAMCAVVAGLAGLGFWIDGKPIGKKISGVVWVLTGAMLLSNLNIIPYRSGVYDFVGGTLMPLAIPMLLFKADLRRVFSESGVVLLTFAIASAATAVAAVLGFYLFPLGDLGAQVAGTYAAGWIGGAVNFLAVSQAVEIPREDFAVVLGASSPVSNIALLLLVLIPATPLLRRWLPSPTIDQAVAAAPDDGEATAPTPLLLSHLATIIAVSFLICALAAWLANRLGVPHYSILIISVIALTAANLLPRAFARLRGDFEFGIFLMYLFFAAIGAGTEATSFVSTAMHLFSYGLFIIVCHLAIVLLAAKLLKIDLAEMLTGSAAALVGPAVTAAIATAQGWRHLVTPGILCGILGYAVGTFIGVGITALLR